jgi:thiopeptide-type bacteriocin biosynthesis protein
VWSVPATADGASPAVPWALVAETVDDLTGAGATCAWFVRKTGVRVRALGDPDVLGPILRQRSADGVAAGAIVRVSAPVYEPELARFGGEAGLALAHELFHRDTPIALAELALDPAAAPPVHHLALGMAIVADLVAAALSDRAERWDVWHRLDEVASAAAPPRSRAAAAADEELGALLGAPDLLLAPPLRPLFERAGAVSTDVAGRLERLAADGTLRVGVRAWLVAAALFAWNRRDLGLDPSALAAATAVAARLAAP